MSANGANDKKTVPGRPLARPLGHDWATKASPVAEALLARCETRPGERHAMPLQAGLATAMARLVAQREERADSIDARAAPGPANFDELARGLSAQERTVVRGHYVQHKQFKEVAREMGLTKGRVAQLHRSALAKLGGVPGAIIDGSGALAQSVRAMES